MDENATCLRLLEPLIPLAVPAMWMLMVYLNIQKARWSYHHLKEVIEM